MNISIENVDVGSIVLKDASFKDELLTVAGAGTTLAGTLLARDSVSKKMIVFVKGGSTNENGIPKEVLTYDVVATGAGDVAIRGLTSGHVNADRLVIAADGDDSNIDADVRDSLRDFSIVATTVTNISTLDNQ